MQLLQCCFLAAKRGDCKCDPLWSTSQRYSTAPTTPQYHSQTEQTCRSEGFPTTADVVAIQLKVLQGDTVNTAAQVQQQIDELLQWTVRMV